MTTHHARYFRYAKIPNVYKVYFDSVEYNDDVATNATNLYAIYYYGIRRMKNNNNDIRKLLVIVMIV